MSRTRTQGDPDVTGYALTDYSGGTSTSRVAHGCKSICTDVVAPGDGHDLTITKTTMEGRLMTGTHPSYSSIWGWRRLENYPMTYYADPTSAQHAAVPVAGRPSDGQLATKLVAQTSPSRPVVDIPVFIGEFGDIPRLVKDAGSTVIGAIAKQNINVQFGLLPLLGDLNSMLHFVDHVDKRMQELRALKAKGLRRTRVLWRGSASETRLNVFTNTSPNWADTRHDIVKLTEITVSGHVRWYPSGDFPTTDRAMLAKAIRAVGGLTIDGSTAWELIPFSWLADWFSNVGDLLKANRNIVPCFHSIPQIMETSKTVNQGILKSADIPSATPGKTVSTVLRKTRRTSPVTLSASLPMLSLRQLSILGSLAILKSGKY